MAGVLRAEDSYGHAGLFEHGAKAECLRGSIGMTGDVENEERRDTLALETPLLIAALRARITPASRNPQDRSNPICRKHVALTLNSRVQVPVYEEFAWWFRLWIKASYNPIEAPVIQF
jgi:hypothetical protein